MNNKDLDTLVDLCRTYGERFDLVQAAGGNISVKTKDGWMFIKPSGCALSTVSRDNSTVISNLPLSEDIGENKYRSITDYSFSGPRASMETYMHSFLPKYVVHLHPIQCNQILVQKDARKICKNLFPDALFLNYVTPGVKLSKKLKNLWKGEKLILLANHGIIVTSDLLPEVKKIIESSLKKCSDYTGWSFDAWENVSKISSIVNQITNGSYVSYLSGMQFGDDFKQESLFPDKVIFCGFKFLHCDKLDKEVFEKFIKENGYIPKVIRHNSDTYFIGKSISKCREIEDIFSAHCILSDCYSLESLTKSQEKELMNMESEKYRSNL